MNSPAYELTRCAVCGTADGTELASAEDVRAEVEMLWAFHTRRLRASTPPAHLTDRLAFSQHAPLRLVRCDECGHVYRNPVERAIELDDAYEDDAPSTDILAALHATQRDAYRAQARRLTRIARGARGRGLEVGSYVGGFLTAARELGWQFEGVDVNETASCYARSLGHRVSVGTIEEIATDASMAERFGAVAIWNCFDQLPDPRAAAVAAHRLLQPNGLIAVRVPNGEFYARLRPLLARRVGGAARLALAHNNLLTFPYRNGFTPASLTRLLGGCGFSVERVVGDTLVPIADRWTRRWAAAEERLVKMLLKPYGKPWIEVYGRKAIGYQLSAISADS